MVAFEMLTHPATEMGPDEEEVEETTIVDPDVTSKSPKRKKG